MLPGAVEWCRGTTDPQAPGEEGTRYPARERSTRQGGLGGCAEERRKHGARETALKRAWFAVRSHCDRHGLSMPADDADFEALADQTIADSKDVLKRLE